jgi:hypothetical protein
MATQSEQAFNMPRRSPKEKVYAAVYGLLQRSKMTKLLAHYALARDGYLVKKGWFDAFAAGMPVDGRGEPLPWLVYPVIELLEERVKPHFRVFEYGSGASSRWWANRVEQVVSVENDLRWHELGMKLAPANLRVLHRERDAYPRAIAEQGTTFHVVVIDGRWRAECSLIGATCLTEDGVLIWDNSERPHYAEAQAALRAKGFKQLRLKGLAPSSVALQETSILYRVGNCLDL